MELIKAFLYKVQSVASMLDRMETPTCSPAALVYYASQKKKSSGGRLGNEAVRLREQRAPLHYNIVSREPFAEALRHWEATHPHRSSSLRSAASIESAPRQQGGSY